MTLTKDPGYETNDGSPVGIYARFVDHFGNPLSGTVEFSAGSEDSPDSQRVKMEPATVTLHWTGVAQLPTDMAIDIPYNSVADDNILLIFMFYMP